jgi:4-hydroxy-tetrahydrodipicolinate synthase
MSRLIEGCPANFFGNFWRRYDPLPIILAGGAGVISVVGKDFLVIFQMVRQGLAKMLHKHNLHYKYTFIDYIYSLKKPAE